MPGRVVCLVSAPRCPRVSAGFSSVGGTGPPSVPCGCLHRTRQGLHGFRSKPPVRRALTYSNNRTFANRDQQQSCQLSSRTGPVSCCRPARSVTTGRCGCGWTYASRRVGRTRLRASGSWCPAKGGRCNQRVLRRATAARPWGSEREPYPPPGRGRVRLGRPSGVGSLFSRTRRRRCRGCDASPDPR